MRPRRRRLRRARWRCARAACGRRGRGPGECYRSPRAPCASASTRRPSIEVEAAQRFGDGFLLRFLQRLFKSLRQGVTLVLFVLKRLLEERVTLGGLLGEDFLGVIELR